MRLLGVLGGMSWTSTATYYRLLNEAVRDRLGGLHSARLLLHSVDFDEVSRLQHDEDWPATADILVEAAQGLKAAGAGVLLLATNTMHKVADEIEAGAGLPLLHIADAAAASLGAPGSSASDCSPPPSPWSRTSTPGGCAPRASTASCRGPRTGPRCTGSSTTSSAATWSPTPLARPSGR
ncbi:hypothetical protein NOCA2220218 [metagenome]|uniref:Aspartate racemase n=1 Tax=metagenome TaxID=256318 RepID=A0A2P2BZ38_9ZZZZ